VFGEGPWAVQSEGPWGSSDVPSEGPCVSLSRGSVRVLVCINV